MNTEKTKPTRQPSHMHKGERYETCRECGLVWNVSKQKEIKASGYLCPRCWSKNRNKQI